ncbi:unnamed protein product [Euphydryas editha]|uniref:CUB domain-containing protein n=1 Tax=Euphydryas editha TaxID=104508 RepID=A0AAU9TF98_EUPED|nr:unnamed protein product [Euphydryas editha]
MEHQKSLVLLLSLFLCVHAKNWYLTNDNGNIKDLFKSQNIRKEEKIKRFIPMNTEEHATVCKKNNSSTIHGYIIPVVSDFKPSNSMRISNIPKSTTIRNVITKDEIKRISSLPYFNLNNIIQRNNLISFDKRKIVQPRYMQINKQYKRINSNGILQSRFLDVFEVVEFEHVSCFSVNGLEGTCLHEHDCQKIGGVTMGTCADGYGTCCVILFTCDGHSSSSSGWFTNPGFPMPSSDRLFCTFTLDKYSDQVQQIRLDFMDFEILPPTSGTCNQDQFLVTGQNINSVIPILCGINSGQHIYVEVSETEGPIVFSFQTISNEKRLFSIKVTQIISSDPLKAPSGCLQYFKEAHGYLESFNYRDTSEIGITRTPSYLNNLNYAICIQRANASCSITYNNVGDMQIINYDTENLPVIPPRQAGVEIFDCPSDWLLISAVRLCGERLNDGSVLQDFTSDAPVTDDGAGPIIVWFRSDGIYAGRGFKLNYQQNSCTE